MTEKMPKQLDSFIHDNLFNFWLAAQTASVIVGRTIGVGGAPGSWSGHELVVQQLTLKVEETICGQPPTSNTLLLSLPLVMDSLIAGSTPELAGWLTQPGSRCIFFLENGNIVDEDLSIVPATASLIEWLRGHCRGPLPKGTPAVLHTLSQIAEADGEVQRIFETVDAAVLDVEEAGRALARLTVVQGKLRLFSGIRLKRVARSRGPDMILGCSAGELARALSGQKPIEALIVTGNAPPLIEAMRAASRVIRDSESLVSQLQAAAGI